MKKILFSLAGFFGLMLWAYGQSSLVQRVYFENFDTLPYSITTGQLGNTPPATVGNKFNDTSVVAVSLPNSFHSQVKAFDTVYFQTNYFSTDTNVYVKLSFFHICIVSFQLQARLQLDTGNGQWFTVPASAYLGASPLYIANQYFNVAAYSPNTPWGAITTPVPGVFPANSQFIKEEFNISAWAAEKNNVRVRFRLEATQNTGLGYNGWFIDDVLVEAAPCEIINPVINANLNPAPIPCFNNAPQGSVPLDTLFQFAMDVTDASGVEAVWLNYSVNGGPWIKDTMNTMPGMPNRYSTSVFGLSVADTVCWFIEAQDQTACENRARFPELDSNCFIITPAPPKRCGDLVCSQFPNIITSFPWIEGFEGPSWVAGTGTGTPPSLTHRGSIPFADRWSVSPAATSGTGWSVRQGPSPNVTSGPENAHSGQKYLYFENSFPAPPGNSQLITPCIDLRNVNGCSALEFFYHKFGNGMGNLRIDIDTGDGTALNNQLWINGVYEIPGSTNTSKTSPWIKAFVSLEKYQGKIIRIRFTGFKGPNDNGDMAIDAIRVYQPGALNVALVSVQAPADGFCEYTSAENIRIRVRNEGCSDLPNLQFRFRENPAVAWTNFTFPFTVTSGMDTLYTLPSPAQANLAAFNTYNMDFQLVLPGDTDTLNNKLSLVVNHNPAIPSLPFLETFNGPNTTAGNGTTNTGTYTGTNLFFNAPLIGPIPAGYNSYGLMVENKFTNTGNTGPARGHGRTGNYVYSEMGFGGFPASAVVFTRCVDLTSTTQPILEFRYHNYGNPANLPPTTIPELGSINVQVKIEGSNNWTNLGPIISSIPSLSNSWENWPLARRDLTPYIGTTIQLRIVVSKSSAAANLSDIGLDNIFIYDRATADAGVDNIGAPNFSATTGAFSFSLFNHGTQALASVPYEVTITPLCGPNANIPSVSNFTYNTSIPAGGSATVSGTVSNPIPRGFFNFKVKTKLVGDPFSFNDSLERKVIGQRSDTIPLFYNFDDCGNTPYTSSSAYPSVPLTITTATNSILFELGTPAKNSINTAFSPPNAWITDLTDNTQRGKTEVLMMPELYGFDTVERVFLRFRHNLKIGTGSAARVEILVGNNWAPLGNASTFGSSATTINNWYSHPTFGTPNATVFGNNEPAWTGSTGGWVMSSFPLQEFNYSTTPRQIRFIMKTSATDNPDNGWAIDNVEIIIPPQRSGSPMEVRSVSPLPVPGPNFFTVRLQNTGAKALDSLKATLVINGTNITTETFYFNPPLLTQQRRWVDFAQPWANAVSGCHDVKVITSRPNGLQDNNIADDTTSKVICVLDVLNQTPYCNSFDTPNDTTWLKKNALVYDDGGQSFRIGAPNKANIDSAASPPWAWVAGNLGGLYKNRDTSALFTPAFSVVPNQTYSMSFKHWIRTERYHDGGTVEVTMDGGATWQILGYPKQGWFNTPYVTIFEIIKPGWTGESNQYEDALINFRFDQPGVAIFRFRFMSDQSIINEGWAIDDFCFDTTSALVDFTVGIDEQPTLPMAIGLPSPNPARTDVSIPMLLNDNRRVNLTITNGMGQVMYHTSENYTAGEHEIQLNVSGFATGMYFISVDAGEAPVVRKLLIQR